MTSSEHRTPAHDAPPRPAGGVPLISLVRSGALQVGPASATGPPPATRPDLPPAA
jgi:hypothetical protein